MDHKTEDTQHVGIAIVKLDGTLREHSFIVKVVPAKVDVAVVGGVHKLVTGSFDIAPEAEIRG